MKLVTIDDCEEGYENEDTLDTKQLDSISKLKDPLANIKARMERLKKPLLERVFVYFMQIGLSGSRINPHQLKAGQDVAHEKLMETFEKIIPRLGFCYTKCWDPKNENQGQKNLAFMLWQGKNVVFQVKCKNLLWGLSLKSSTRLLVGWHLLKGYTLINTTSFSSEWQGWKFRRQSWQKKN